MIISFRFVPFIPLPPPTPPSSVVPVIIPLTKELPNVITISKQMSDCLLDRLSFTILSPVRELSFDKKQTLTYLFICFSVNLYI